jgi:hypothetical protein
VLQQAPETIPGALDCADTVVCIWEEALSPLVLGPDHPRRTAGGPAGAAAAVSSSDAAAATWGDGPGVALARLPVGPLQLMEVVDMLGDVARLQARERGAGHASVGQSHLVTALALLYLGEAGR